MNKFVPKKNQAYFMVNSRLEVAHSINGGGIRSNARISAGNCFETKPEAELFLEQIQDKLPITKWEHFKKAMGL